MHPCVNANKRFENLPKRPFTSQYVLCTEQLLEHVEEMLELVTVTSSYFYVRGTCNCNIVTFLLSNCNREYRYPYFLFYKKNWPSLH